MEGPEKKSKSLIPKRAQVPLVAVGFLLLAYFAWDTANRMGWIGGPPKAKTPVAAKQPAQPPAGGGAATQPPQPPGAARPTPARPPGASSGSPATNLDSLRAPARDPMAELGSTAAPAPGPGATRPPPTPAPAPAPGGEPPPLPPPMPTPGGATPGFPSPTVGAPAAVPTAAAPIAPAPRGVPAALAVTYPLARRGTRAQAQAAPVTVLGTISGNRGSLAVVHPGEAARGQYVKPGDTVAGSGARVESISPGSVRIGGRGGSRELTVRSRRTAPSATPQAASPTPVQPADAAPKPE